MRNTIDIHDMLTAMLLNYGYLTLLAAGIFLVRQLWKLHSFVFREPEPLARSIGATCLALGLAIASGATTNGAQFSTYPVNFYIWFNFAIVGSLLMYARERDARDAPEAAPAEAPPWMRSHTRVAPARQGPLPAPAAAKA